MVGYTGKELSKKLGIKAGNRVAVLDAPDEVELGDMPDEVRLDNRLGLGPYHVMLLFARTKADLQERLPKAQTKLDKNGVLWVCWPTAGEADLAEGDAREVSLAQGLFDAQKVIPVDDAWSALRCLAAERPKKAAKR